MRRNGLTLQFRDNKGNFWVHSYPTEEEVRATVEKIGSDMNCSMVLIDGDRKEVLFRPGWAEGLELSSLLPEKEVAKKKPRHYLSFSGSDSPNNTSKEVGSEGLGGRVALSSGNFTKEEQQIMATKIEVEICATEEETIGKAKELIAGHFEQLKSLRKTVAKFAIEVFGKLGNPERIAQNELVSATRYEMRLAKMSEISTDMVLEVLKAEGFEGAGERGPKGVALPGTSAKKAAEAPAAPAATETTATQAAPVAAAAPVNGGTQAAPKQDKSGKKQDVVATR